MRKLSITILSISIFCALSCNPNTEPELKKLPKGFIKLHTSSQDQNILSSHEYIGDYLIEFNTNKQYYLIYAAVVKMANTKGVVHMTVGKDGVIKRAKTDGVVKKAKTEPKSLENPMGPEKELLAFEILTQGTLKDNEDLSYVEGSQQYRLYKDKRPKGTPKEMGLHFSVNEIFRKMDLDAVLLGYTIHPNSTKTHPDFLPISLIKESINLKDVYSEKEFVTFQLGFITFDEAQASLFNDYAHSEFFKTFVSFGSVHESLEASLALKNFKVEENVD